MYSISEIKKLRENLRLAVGQDSMTAYAIIDQLLAERDTSPPLLVEQERERLRKAVEGMKNENDPAVPPPLLHMYNFAINDVLKLLEPPHRDGV